MFTFKLISYVQRAILSLVGTSIEESNDSINPKSYSLFSSALMNNRITKTLTQN